MAAPEITSTEGVGEDPTRFVRRRKGTLPRIWAMLVPFFLSAALFVSAFLVIFSPIPLLMLFFRYGRLLTWTACATNLALVFLLGGVPSGVSYSILVLCFVIPAGEVLLRRGSLEKAAILAFSVMAAGVMAVLLILAHQHGQSPAFEYKAQVSRAVEFFTAAQNASSVTSAGGGKELALTGAEREDWKNNLVQELPSGVAVFGLIIIWANLVFLCRANPPLKWHRRLGPTGAESHFHWIRLRDYLTLKPDFFQTWKASEWLIWPTIVCGIFLVFDAGRMSIVAVNCFKFFMAIYAIQGLSVLSYFFNLWGIKGLFRVLGFLFIAFVMMPLLLSIGFFDLWFDFRSKFRQS